MKLTLFRLGKPLLIREVGKRDFFHWNGCARKRSVITHSLCKRRGQGMSSIIRLIFVTQLGKSGLIVWAI
ncbi:MAG TPA: hypothetical protein VIH28_05520 [Ignavibacteriaceae bacterium]